MLKKRFGNRFPTVRKSEIRRPGSIRVPTYAAGPRRRRRRSVVGTIDHNIIIVTSRTVRRRSVYKHRGGVTPPCACTKQRRKPWPYGDSNERRAGLIACAPVLLGSRRRGDVLRETTYDRWRGRPEGCLSPLAFASFQMTRFVLWATVRSSSLAGTGAYGGEDVAPFDTSNRARPLRRMREIARGRVFRPSSLPVEIRQTSPFLDRRAIRLRPFENDRKSRLSNKRRVRPQTRSCPNEMAVTWHRRVKQPFWIGERFRTIHGNRTRQTRWDTSRRRTNRTEIVAAGVHCVVYRKFFEIRFIAIYRTANVPGERKVSAQAV